MDGTIFNRHKSGSRSAHVVHFSAAFYTQSPVETAVQLDQHSLPRHALAAYPVLGRTPSPRTAQTGLTRMRRRVALPMSMPSRSLNLGKLGLTILGRSRYRVSIGLRPTRSLRAPGLEIPNIR